MAGLAAASRPASRMAPLSVSWMSRRAASGPSDEIANQPATSRYGPCRLITVVGSKAAQASAFPPNSRAMVWALLPAFGKKSPATSTNALNMSGCKTVKSTAQVPPMDQPATPQLDRSGLTPKVETI